MATKDQLPGDVKAPDLLLPVEIRDGLKTSIFGRERIDYCSVIDSTNVRARMLADEGAPEGTIVVAEAQLKGKGRRGRSWFSPAGQGIYVSVILRPRVPPAEATLLVLMAAVAAAEALLSHADLPVSVKWPNDILVGGKKIAGILTEMRLDGDRIDHVVIGMGVNVNTPAESLPPEIGAIATSLSAKTGRTFSRAGLLRTYLEKLEGWYTLFRERRFEPIRGRWLEIARIIGKHGEDRRGRPHLRRRSRRHRPERVSDPEIPRRGHPADIGRRCFPGRGPSAPCRIRRLPVIFLDTTVLSVNAEKKAGRESIIHEPFCFAS